MLLLKPLRFLAKALAGEESPKRLAAGFAVGMAVGLVPKSTLTAQLLTAALFGLRINIGAGMLAAFLFSLAAVPLDPATHRIGEALLSAESLRPLWTALYGLPIVPWTGIFNTVALGSILLAAALAYPVYRAVEPLFAKYQPKVAARLKKYKVVQLLLGADLAGRLR